MPPDPRPLICPQDIRCKKSERIRFLGIGARVSTLINGIKSKIKSKIKSNQWKVCGAAWNIFAQQIFAEEKTDLEYQICVMLAHIETHSSHWVVILCHAALANM